MCLVKRVIVIILLLLILFCVHTMQFIFIHVFKQENENKNTKELMEINNRLKFKMISNLIFNYFIK